jgi:hypothetical protein
MTDAQTIHDVTYDLLRSLGLTTVFGNPGSTEQTFLQRSPDDFTYVLALAGTVSARHGRRICRHCGPADTGNGVVRSVFGATRWLTVRTTAGPKAGLFQSSMGMDKETGPAGGCSALS